MICLIGLVGSWGHAAAEPHFEGRVRLESGEPAVGAQVLLFDLADLRASPVAATTDVTGRFTLPLTGLAGVLPERLELGSNYPNPFNPSTIIPYQLPTSMHVRLEVYNLLGQRVATLVDGEQPAGFHTASWDATDEAGVAVGAGVYLYRLSGDGVHLTRSMLLIDGRAGVSRAGPAGAAPAEEEAGEEAPVSGLTVSGPGLVPYIDPAFRVEAGMAPQEVVIEAIGRVPPAKAASSGGILGDVDNNGRVDFFDALLVALYSRDSGIVMPNNGDISLGDVDADGEVDLTDAWLISVWLNDPSDPSLPAGIGEPVGPAASLSPDPSTVAFSADGAWHRFTVQAGEPVTVVVNPEGTTPRLEITTRSGRGNFCPAEADDDVSRQDGQTVYLAGCATGPATVELRRPSDGTVLNTYTFEVTGSPDLVVESVSVSDSTLTPGQAFRLRATVRNQGTGQSAATTLRWYRSSNRTISTRDTQVGTDAVGVLGASRSSAESIRLTAPSEGTWYYGACVVSVSDESNTRNNCSTGIRVTVAAAGPDLVVESVSVSDSTLTSGQSFTLSAIVRNQGADQSAATTLRWYRSTNATIATRDTQVGTDQVGALAASDSSAESIRLTAPSSEGTYYYGACVASVAGEGNPRNNCSAAVTLSVARTLSLSSDREALVALYHATDGPNWTYSTNWLSDKPLGDWHGVTVAGGRVTELALGQNQLTGPLPSELGNLTSLQYMALWENQLTGPIPPELGQLTKLYSLNLGHNQLTGSLPTELGQLTGLEDLSFAVNQLTGPIPRQFGRLTRLISLQLQYNSLTGSIPTELGNLQGLTWLGLRDNLLAGPIPPQLGQLTKLEELFLDSNLLTGEIPPELGQLTKLKRLFLDSNQLTGEIPPELGQLTKLIHLGLSFNQLSGPLPEELIALPLEYFALAETQVCVPRAVEFEEWLKGIELPPPYPYCRDPQLDALSAFYEGTGGPNWRNKTNWLSLAPLGEWYGVTTDGDGRVTELNLEDNNLSGTVPLALGNLPNLKTLNLAFNASLFGPLPQVITGLPLEEIKLQGTEVCAPPQAEFQEWLNGISVSTGVTGCTDTRVDYYALVELYNATDGPNWTNATNWASAAPLNEWHGVNTDSGGRVTRLTLQDNNLQGPLPTILGRLTNLSSLNLDRNQLTGEIPSELGQLTKLQELAFAVNQMTGEIPSDLGQLAKLSTLNFLQNQLTGEIPLELGQLTNLESLHLSINQLTGEIPSELGQLTSLKELFLDSNQLTGEIPSELGQLTNLESLHLGPNLLTGEIPPELGQLTNLQGLGLSWSQLTGEIPPELGQLANLSNLYLSTNQLTGEIPPELGQLGNLLGLDLSANQLTGEIPPELGRLQNLETLQLQSNKLKGEIPSELGQLTNLSGELWNVLVPGLNLSANQLTGEIPPELGQLRNLLGLDLSTNQLTGEIPPELGQLTNLAELNLSSNQLTGNVPSELGDLGNLRSLNLAYNGALSGTLPHGLTRLTLENLALHETFLCTPQDADFQSWLFGIAFSRIPNCARVDASTAYLTQATQSLEFPVPLVAGEPALLRVFVTAGQDVDATMPPVRATFYRDGAEVHTAEMGGRATSIPWQVNEGDLSSSANAVVPASVVMPGLEMVVEIDPDRTLDAALGIGARLPATGRTAVNVRSVPPFDLTLVPFLWTEQPDSTVLTQVEGLTSESDLFRLTRDILPVGDFSLTVHEPVWTSVDPTSDANAVLGPETELIYAMEGASGYYMAVFRSQGGSGLKGQAQRPGSVSLSILDANTIAHELGHNLSLDHAPACGAGDPDPDFPYEDGSIGVWGYDFLNETLVNPGTSDIMTYCDLQWISEFSFAKAMGYRSRSASPRLAAKYSTSPRGLLLWGGLNESGELFLEPTFVVSAPPLPPRLDGPYRLTGEDEEGDEVFTQSFGMPEYGCGGRGGSFAFILPVGREWPKRLARIVLSGPEGVSILDGEEDPSAALLLDRTTGSVRGVLRDWQEAAGKGAAGKPLAAPRALPEPGLEVLTSRGLPDSASWVR